MADTRVCAIAGSLRTGSYNKALLRAAQELAPPGVRIAIWDGLRSIPPFDQDEQVRGDPAPVVALKAAIAEADVLLIATPEYNYGIPGVLKNAFDWASRPAGKSVLNGKPAAIVGATVGLWGTVRAQLALRQSFLFTESPVLLKPEVLVARAQDKFDASLRLTDETTRAMLRQLLVALPAFVARFR
ncbi:MAG: NAD(P)H-dependent oxidoreductase [Deltaproteobacteria bacterium]|nr:NAD(P)H-dependent oxidoreductase [Deltaproteobacteria bacterium]